MNIFRKGNYPPPLERRFRGSGLLVMALVGAAVVGITSLSLAKANAIAINSIGSNKVALQAQQYASAKGELYRTMKYSELTAQAKRDIQNSNGFQDEVTVSAETDYPFDSTVKQKLCTVRVYKTGESVPRASMVVTRYSKGQGDSSVPSGSIIPWYGNIADIPSGYLLCDGTNGTPDLRDRFIVGAGNSYLLSAICGEDTVILTTAQMPSHTHTGSTSSSGAHSHPLATQMGSNDAWGLSWSTGDYVTTRYTGTGGAHSHTMNLDNTGGSEAHENRPPYYALYYIMKV